MRFGRTLSVSLQLVRYSGDGLTYAHSDSFSRAQTRTSETKFVQYNPDSPDLLQIHNRPATLREPMVALAAKKVQVTEKIFAACSLCAKTDPGGCDNGTWSASVGSSSDFMVLFLGISIDLDVRGADRVSI